MWQRSSGMRGYRSLGVLYVSSHAHQSASCSVKYMVPSAKHAAWQVAWVWLRPIVVAKSRAMSSRKQPTKLKPPTVRGGGGGGFGGNGGGAGGPMAWVISANGSTDVTNPSFRVEQSRWVPAGILTPYPVLKKSNPMNTTVPGVGVGVGVGVGMGMGVGLGTGIGTWHWHLHLRRS